jgi:plastocyanin
MLCLRIAARIAAVSLLAFVAVDVAVAAPVTTIAIDNFMFTPMTVSVPVGGTVTWVNNDDIPHTVRAVDGSFHSPALDTDDHYSFTFTKAGVYSYFCSIHPKMVAKVIVKAE